MLREFVLPPPHLWPLPAGYGAPASAAATVSCLCCQARLLACLADCLQHLLGCQAALHNNLLLLKADVVRLNTCKCTTAAAAAAVAARTSVRAAAATVTGAMIGCQSDVGGVLQPAAAAWLGCSCFLVAGQTTCLCFSSEQGVAMVWLKTTVHAG